MNALSARERRDRSRARAWFLQVHYRWEAEGEGTDLDQALQATLERRVSPRRVPYLNRLVRTFAADRERIDSAVADSMDNWRMDRLSAMDRGILRLGATELTSMTDVPGKVAIHEAVRLAERYSGPDSARFVNGILDALFRRMREQRAAPQSESPAAPPP